MMDHKKLTNILLLSAAGVLLLLMLTGLLLGPRAEQAPIEQAELVVTVSATEAPEVVSVDASEPTPEPVETPALPAGAATLLVDRTPVLTLASEDELRTLLSEYLSASAVAPEGERFVSASFACELILAEASADAHVSDYADALVLLTNRPAIVPVRVVTQKTVTTATAATTASEDDPALARGSRILTQVGADGAPDSIAVRTYVAGELTDESAPTVKVTRESRAFLMRVGTWTSRGDTPGKDEGKKGKDAGELKLSYPMRGSVSSYFGMRNGNMHNGVDIYNKAGTAVTAPGEGLVVYCGVRGAYGFVVDVDHGNGFLSRLTHLDPDSVQVELHQRVFGGDPIGTLAAAETGKKPHLHYELIVDSVPLNPLFYIG